MANSNILLIFYFCYPHVCAEIPIRHWHVMLLECILDFLKDDILDCILNVWITAFFQLIFLLILDLLLYVLQLSYWLFLR